MRQTLSCPVSSAFPPASFDALALSSPAAASFYPSDPETMRTRRPRKESLASLDDDEPLG